MYDNTYQSKCCDGFYIKFHIIENTQLYFIIMEKWCKISRWIFVEYEKSYVDKKNICILLLDDALIVIIK